MKNKIVSLILIAAMALTMLVGCGATADQGASGGAANLFGVVNEEYKVLINL